MSDSMSRGDALHLPMTRDHVRVSVAVEQVESTLIEAGCTATEAQLFAAATEEVLVNVANHAWPIGEEHAFDAWLSLTPGAGTLEVRLVVEDDGIAFDPTRQAPAADVDTELDDRAIGGLGVHMVRRLTDEQRYMRVGDRNIMTIGKMFQIGSADQA